MKIAITGTTTGLGKELKDTLEIDHQVVGINRKDFENLVDVDLTGIDVLINNAGHSLGGGVGLKGHCYESWKSIIDVNLTAPIHLTQKFINQNTNGIVIFVTSKAIEKFIGGDSVYTAAKTGLSAFIDCLRDEIKDTNFRLVEIRPGRIKTSFAKNRQIHKDNAVDFYNHVTHMNTKEVVNAITFALSSSIVEKITLSK